MAGLYLYKSRPVPLSPATATAMDISTDDDCDQADPPKLVRASGDLSHLFSFGASRFLSRGAPVAATASEDKGFGFTLSSTPTVEAAEALVGRLLLPDPSAFGPVSPSSASAFSAARSPMQSPLRKSGPSTPSAPIKVHPGQQQAGMTDEQAQAAGLSPAQTVRSLDFSQIEVRVARTPTPEDLSPHPRTLGAGAGSDSDSDDDDYERYTAPEEDDEEVPSVPTTPQLRPRNLLQRRVTAPPPGWDPLSEF